MIASEPTASVVGTHGRCSEKNAAREHQHEAAEREAEGEPEQRVGGQRRSTPRPLAALEDQLDDRRPQSTSIAAPAGISSSAIWRRPMPIVACMPA